MTETTQQMEHRWALLMAARDAKTGVRIHDTDQNYQRECAALRVQIEERKAAEASRPQINRDQLAWLDQLKGTRDADGKQLLFDMGQRGTAFRRRVDAAQAALERGQDISSVIANSERDIAAQKMTMGDAPAAPKANYRDMDGNMMGNKVLLPPGAATVLGAGTINTTRNKV